MLNQSNLSTIKYLNQKYVATLYIINAECYQDPERNGLETLEAGKLYLNYDYSPVPPLENLNFNAQITSSYLVELLPGNAA